MDDEMVPEFYDTEWEVPGTRHTKPPAMTREGDRIARETEDYNTSTSFLAPLKSWIWGYLSH